ncbi:QacE family quaternary ammonium compound efflux SMR transporter [Variovorax boronicumulans]|uniref:Guanidinium exporter n=1 Tax=Variovorax boronicumulans TaxID=436515 RepID=A0A250DTV7_9BURK|nr:multidrug efflux SMR transporter [Variovorax boronicumulans]ATA57810.1 QacE family quaternary ammonium compound efflux SMR transporter [Variovorax boronicumulans]
MNAVTAWVALFAAGGLEILFAVGLKSATRFDRPWVLAGTIASLLCSLSLLTFSLRHLPVGSAYAVWTGIGAVGTAIVGMVLLGESASALRLLCIGLIVMGVVGLKSLH